MLRIYDRGYPTRYQIVPDANPRIETVGIWTRTAVAGIGFVNVWEVPPGRRYVFEQINIVRTSGDATIDTIYYGSPLQVLTVSSGAAAVNQDTGRLYPPLVLDEFFRLAINIAAITGDSVGEIRAAFYDIPSVRNIKIYLGS